MDQNKIIERLREPFAFKDVEWKIQYANPDKASALAVPYIDSRAIQKRLDETAGIFGWRNEFAVWHDKSQICGISIYDNERKDWVTKFDGAENSDIEPIKGGLSDAFKRAAVLWNIGRYLYELDGVWVDVEAKGKSYAIKQDQYPRLETAYNAAIAKLFGAAVPPPNQNSVPNNQPNLQPQAPQQPPPENEEPPLPEPPPAPSTPAEEAVYRVNSIKPSGKSSQAVELIHTDTGEMVTAYIQKSDQSIKAGASLRRVQIQKKSSTYGDYHVLSNYELAA